MSGWPHIIGKPPRNLVLYSVSMGGLGLPVIIMPSVFDISERGSTTKEKALSLVNIMISLLQK